ncbi:hypothetical protein Lal_00014147 [Lupinus albus]|nr:hypothetical protein Lal_00014147 [Lupinus albus]
MASSSKRRRTSKSKQGESSSKSNPLNLTRLLAYDAQRKCSMNFRKNLMTSHVKGNDIVLDIQTFSSICCDIPMTGDITGFGLVCDWDDYDRKRFYLSICRIPKEEIESDIELQLMYAIKYNIKINWAKMIMQQMWHVRGSQSLLPYAIFITKILEHFGVSLDGETKVALNLRESKIDIEVVRKMGFVLDPVTRQTYKHRTDRQTAPTNQLEPTTHYQPEFQAPSSTSTTMPSNKMIMDELVSLRGYITTRMDVIDTHNQQINYELHHLSSRFRV